MIMVMIIMIEKKEETDIKSGPNLHKGNDLIFNVF